jgi:hypothetical protein
VLGVEVTDEFRPHLATLEARRGWPSGLGPAVGLLCLVDVDVDVDVDDLSSLALGARDRLRLRLRR